MICLKPLLSLLRYGQFPPTNLQTGDNKEPENVQHRHTDYIQLYIHNRFITKSNILNQQNKFAQLDLNVSILFCGMIFLLQKIQLHQYLINILFQDKRHSLFELQTYQPFIPLDLNYFAVVISVHYDSGCNLCIIGIFNTNNKNFVTSFALDAISQ